MHFVPSQSRRNVVLAFQIVNAASNKAAPNTSENACVTCISAIFVNEKGITESLYTGKDEAGLLLRFWRDLRRGDRIFSANVLKEMTLLRERSWQLGVLPSLEIDLRCVYEVEMWDTEKMWATGYVPHVPYRIHTDEPCSRVDFEHLVHIAPECVHSRD